MVPELANQFPEKIVVEIVENDKSRGIYFVAPKTTANQLLKSTGIEYQVEEDLILDSGMKITIISKSNNSNVTVSKIESAKRLALSMPLDINRVTETDLISVSGIGEVTAKKILDVRSKLGRYKNIEQLTEIKGIKVCRQAKGNWQECFDEREDPHNKKYYWLSGSFHNKENDTDTDLWALENNYVSIVPITLDYTKHEQISALKNLESNV